MAEAAAPAPAAPKPTIVVRVKEAICDGDASYSPGTVTRIDRDFALQVMKDRPGRFLEEATESDLATYEKDRKAAAEKAAKAAKSDAAKSDA